MRTDREQRIVQGQRVEAGKAQRARELRQHMTSAEAALWQHLRGNRFQRLHFRRQQVIDGFIADFFCHAAKLVVEVDGPIHEDQATYDRERDHVLSARGLRLLRVTNDEVQQDCAGVLTRIAVACQGQMETEPPTS